MTSFYMNIDKKKFLRNYKVRGYEMRRPERLLKSFLCLQSWNMCKDKDD
jgi:hypothetical protein